MKTRTRKMIAWLIAAMMIFQVIPALAEVFVSNEASGSEKGYKEALTIINNDGTYLLSGHTIHLSANEDYQPEWSSSNEAVATVSADGTVTAVGAGNVTITATAGKQSDSIVITVINPEQSYTVTYNVTYPANALTSRYGDTVSTKPQDSTFTESTNPVTGSGAASYEVNAGDFDCENYRMTGWVTESGEFLEKGQTIKVSKDITLTAKFEVTTDYIATNLKFKARYLAEVDGTVYFKGAKDANSPAGYPNNWKWMTSYGNKFADENGNLMLTFRMPESNREANATQGYTSTAAGQAPKTLAGYRLLKIIGYDGDISEYQTKVYAPNEVVTLPFPGGKFPSNDNGGYFFEPVFDETQTGEAVVKIRMNGDKDAKADYVGQGQLSQAGIDALSSTPWGKNSGILTANDSDEAHIYGGSDTLTPVSSAYYKEETLPTVKEVLNMYGMSAEDPDNWDIIWYKVANTRTGYLIEGSLVKNEAALTAPKMVIVVNGATVRRTYNGQEQTLTDYTATSNNPDFDPAKVELVGEIGASRTDCGTAILVLSPNNFKYNDKNVKATFVVSNGWLKIIPARVKVVANNLVKAQGTKDPELTAKVTGLIGDDTIEYEITREEGEEIGLYTIEPTGEDQQGNYAITYQAGKLSIQEAVERGDDEYFYTIRYIVRGEYTNSGEDEEIKDSETKNFDPEDRNVTVRADSVEGYTLKEARQKVVISSDTDDVVTFEYVPEAITCNIDCFDAAGKKIGEKSFDAWYGKTVTLETELPGYLFDSCDQGELTQTINLDNNYFVFRYTAVERSVTIQSSLDGVDEVYSGTEVVLTAVPEGFDGIEYTVRWQYETADGELHEIEGANELTYTYEITPENAGYIYHVIVEPVE